MDFAEKAKELNYVMRDENLTVTQKQAFVDTLTEEEMRGIFKEMMTIWYSKEMPDKSYKDI